jgi:hypothetical protein
VVADADQINNCIELVENSKLFYSASDVRFNGKQPNEKRKFFKFWAAKKKLIIKSLYYLSHLNESQVEERERDRERFIGI